MCSAGKAISKLQMFSLISYFSMTAGTNSCSRNYSRTAAHEATASLVPLLSILTETGRISSTPLGNNFRKSFCSFLVIYLSLVYLSAFGILSESFRQMNIIDRIGLCMSYVTRTRTTDAIHFGYTFEIHIRGSSNDSKTHALVTVFTRSENRLCKIFISIRKSKLSSLFSLQREFFY